MTRRRVADSIVQANTCPWCVGTLQVDQRILDELALLDVVSLRAEFHNARKFNDIEFEHALWLVLGARGAS